MAAAAPATGGPVEPAGNGAAAAGALAVISKFVTADGVPVPVDNRCAAAGAGGAPAVWVVDVAGVDEAQPVLLGNPAGPGQRGRGGRQHVAHLEGGVEGGEVHRHVITGVAGAPGALRRHLGGWRAESI